MASPTEYARLPLFINGAYIRQLTSLELTFNSGQQRVDLLNEGFAGFTPGSGDVTVRVGFAVPIGGVEYPYMKDLVSGSFAEVQVGVGAEVYAGKGKFTELSLNQSVNASLEGSGTWVGQLAAPE